MVFLANVGVASADRSDDCTGKFRATFTKNRMAFPSVIERGWKKPIEVIGQKLFKISAAHRRFGHGAQQDACFQLLRCGQSAGSLTGLHSVLYFTQSLMANRAPQGMFGKRLVARRAQVCRQGNRSAGLQNRYKASSLLLPPLIFISSCIVPRRAGLQV